MKLLDAIKAAEAKGKGKGPEAKAQRQLVSWLKELYVFKRQDKAAQDANGDWLICFLPNPIDLGHGWYFHSAKIQLDSPFSTICLMKDDGATIFARLDLARRAFTEGAPFPLSWLAMEELHHRIAVVYRSLIQEKRDP